MVNNVTDRALPTGGAGYNHSVGVVLRPTQLKTATEPGNRLPGTDLQNVPDKKIPMQVWQERAGKTMNALKQKIRFTINPSDGEVIMETGKKSGDSGIDPDLVINTLKSQKGNIIKEII